MKNNRKIKNQLITSIAALFLIVNCLLSTVNCHAQSWKTYPYQEPGSVILFPDDEGWHPGVAAEWWYTTAHLTGVSTGTAYSFMLTYFYFPVALFDGFRIFNIANETTGEFFQNMQPCTYVLAQDHLDIQAMVGIIPEEWVTLQDSAGVLIPFEYHLSAHSPDGDIDLVYDMVKRPLMVGDDGFVYLAETDSSYYYSQTKLTVEGTLTLKGFTEPVTGTAWIDRQYGEMNPQWGSTVWEWFSYQLSNGMDLNVWNLFNAQDQIPDTPTYKFCSIYINDSTAITTSNFTLTRQKYAWMPDNQRCYSQEWHFTYANIDLTITTNFSDQEVILPFRFYEGSTTIQGTVDSVPVTGIGFAELLHSYEDPNIAIIKPDGIGVWDGTQPVTWQLLNPDDGRPVYYDLELSTDEGFTYVPVVQGLTDTMYYWDFSGIDSLTPCQLRLTGYSVDSTLTGNFQTVPFFVTGITGIDDRNEPAHEITAYAFPNPFNSETTIHIELKKPGFVSVDIYNLQGELIKTLLNEYRKAGLHQLTWDGKDKNQAVPAGIYLIRMDTNIDTYLFTVIYNK